MSTGLDLVKASLRLIRAIGAGETPSAEDSDDALKAINLMLEAWGLERLIVSEIRDESFTLAVSTASYTIGSGQTWNTTKPTMIQSAYVRESTIDYPVSIITSKMYYALSQKALTSTLPDKLYYLNALNSATGTVYVHPVPTVANTIYLQTWRPITAFTLAGTVALPPGYERAIKYNGAIELAPEWGKVASAEIVEIARESKAAIKRINNARTVISCDAAMRGVSGGNYNIDSDDYE